MFPNKLTNPNEAANMAMDRLEEATSMARAKRGPVVDDQTQFVRYQELSQDPVRLFDFVARSLGTRDPDKLRAGTQSYLAEMQRRFGG
jgi:hypothetical protein